MKLFENLVKNTIIVDIQSDSSEQIFEENIISKSYFKFK